MKQYEGIEIQIINLSEEDAIRTSNIILPDDEFEN